MAASRSVSSGFATGPGATLPRPNDTPVIARTMSNADKKKMMSANGIKIACDISTPA